MAALAATLPWLWREIAQAEYRAIETTYKVRSAMPWWIGWDFTKWNKHSIQDVAIPALVTFVLALGMMFV